MSTINSSLLSNYYSLTNTDNSSTSTSISTSSSSSSSLSDTLASLLDSDSADTADGGSSDNSYMLDLSPEAQSYLSSMNMASSTSTGTASTPTTSSSDIILTNAQQAKLNQIIDKYKDAPYTQDTFDDMQNDLEEAGLGTDQLNAEDRMRSLNPTQMLIDALNGQTDDLSSLTDTSNDATKATNFMNKVISQWQGVSSTYDPNADADSTAGATTDTTASTDDSIAGAAAAS